MAYTPATHAPVPSIAPGRSFKFFSVILIVPAHRESLALCAQEHGIGNR
jgi:hypothetical protein